MSLSPSIYLVCDCFSKLMNLTSSIFIIQPARGMAPKEGLLPSDISEEEVSLFLCVVVDLSQHIATHFFSLFSMFHFSHIRPIRLSWQLEHLTSTITTYHTPLLPWERLSKEVTPGGLSI
jgi:hypothetical protein